MQIPSKAPQLPLDPSDRQRIEVSVKNQSLSVIGVDGREQAVFPVSTSKYGLGSEEGSHRTPLGRFAIDDMIGHDAPERTVFRSRKPVGRWQPEMVTADDLVLTRILWLTGLEESNANTRDRYIYIHGTNQEHLIGTPASHGCVRMLNADVVTLFDMVQPGTEVLIG